MKQPKNATKCGETILVTDQIESTAIWPLFLGDSLLTQWFDFISFFSVTHLHTHRRKMHTIIIQPIQIFKTDLEWKWNMHFSKIDGAEKNWKRKLKIRNDLIIFNFDLGFNEKESGSLYVRSTEYWSLCEFETQLA